MTGYICLNKKKSSDFFRSLGREITFHYGTSLLETGTGKKSIPHNKNTVYLSHLDKPRVKITPRRGVGNTGSPLAVQYSHRAPTAKVIWKQNILI